MKFTKDDVVRFQDFRCGSLPHEAPLSDWIKQHSIRALDNKTKIWYYETDDAAGDLVGYGSVGKNPLSLPADMGFGAEVVKVVSLPCLAIAESHWHKPADASDREDRFSYQIVRHLQKQAKGYCELSPVLKPLLSLYVHPDATAARKLYTNCGFQEIPGQSFHDKLTGADCALMIFDLRTLDCA